MSEQIYAGDTVTVTIGRNVPESSELAMFPVGDETRPMKLHHWNAFRQDVTNTLGSLQPRALFVYEGRGEWSDGEEDSFCFVMLADSTYAIDPITSELADLAKRYDQEAIGFAFGPGRLVTTA